MNPTHAYLLTVALMTGAAAEGSKLVVKDCYRALKSLVRKALPSFDWARLETGTQRPEVKQEVLWDLGKSEIVLDEQLGDALIRLLEAIRTQSAETAQRLGVRLDRISGNSLRIRDIESAGSGVEISNAALKGDIEIEGVRAGPGPHNTSISLKDTGAHEIVIATSPSVGGEIRIEDVQVTGGIVIGDDHTAANLRRRWYSDGAQP